LSEWLKVVILGIVEGVTEFLPISSTGHLIVVSALIDFHSSLRVTFDIFIQVGTVFAVLAVYQEELRRQARVVRYDRSVQLLWRNLIIAFLPLGVIGFLLRDWIKTTLFSPWVVAASLVVGGVLMILIERSWVERQRITTTAIRSVSLRQALVVGVAQVFALIPGVSRAAASIMGGMFAGLDRTAATEFSFFLAIPTLGIATLGELALSLSDIQSSDLGYLVLGALVSAVVGWASVRWLLRYVARHDFVVFGVYRIVAGLFIAGLILGGWFPSSF
jgi:undecaprenyl-diphosphatase